MTSTTRDRFDGQCADAGHGDAQLLQLHEAPATAELADVQRRRAANDVSREAIERLAALDVLARCMADGTLGG